MGFHMWRHVVVGGVISCSANINEERCEVLTQGTSRYDHVCHILLQRLTRKAMLNSKPLQDEMFFQAGVGLPFLFLVSVQCTQEACCKDGTLGTVTSLLTVGMELE